MADELALYKGYSLSLRRLDSEIAKHLAATPGAMLTTIPGINLGRAPGLYWELADPSRRRGVGSMCALAGVVP